MEPFWKRNIVSILVIFFGIIFSLTGLPKTSNFNWGFALIVSGLVTIILDYVSPMVIHTDEAPLEKNPYYVFVILIGVIFIIWLIYIL
jgi:bacteriorhodopsin